MTEIRNETGVSYFVKLEDEKNWLTIKADAQGYLGTSKVQENLKIVLK